MASQNEKDSRGPEYSAKIVNGADHHYSEEDHEHAAWEGEGGNPGPSKHHDHKDDGDPGDEHSDRQATASELIAAAQEDQKASEEKGTDSGDGSIRNVSALPQRLDEISPVGRTLISELAKEVWNNGFAMVGGVIPVKSDGKGGFVIDEARETGTFNNIGDRNRSQTGKLMMTLAMQELNLTGEVERQFITSEKESK